MLWERTLTNEYTDTGNDRDEEGEVSGVSSGGPILEEDLLSSTRKLETTDWKIMSQTLRQLMSH